MNLVKSYIWCTVLVNLPNCKDRIITLLWNNEYVSCSDEVFILKSGQWQFVC